MVLENLLVFAHYISGLDNVQGKTVEVGRAYFETENTRFTILDAPVSSLLFLVNIIH